MAERLEATTPDPAGPAAASELNESSDRQTSGGERVSAPAIAASSIAVGTRLENTYEVKKLLGQGAMGAVYLVEHVGLGKQFAAKVVSASRALDESAIARLRHEARITSAIEHENIVNVTHLGATPDGSLFIVMELLRGESLGARLRLQLERSRSSEGPRWIPDDEVRTCVSAILSALAAAHAAGVIHRDLKPDNVFLSQTRSGAMRPKIVDFGIGKLSSPTGTDLRLTETGQTVGTPLYMAPEQFRAASDVGPPADLYALGVVIFEMVTGELPFHATHVFEMVLKHATEPARDPRELRPDLPARVAELVLKCLAKDPHARFASADAMHDAWREAWSDGTAPGKSQAAPGAKKARAPDARREPRAPAASARGGSTLRWWMLPAAVIAGAALVFAVDRAIGDPPVPRPERVAVQANPPAPVEPPASPEVVRAPPVPPPSVEPPRTEMAVATRTHHVTTDPPGAEVILAGATVGHTPFELSVGAEATVEIELRLSGRRHVQRVLPPGSPLDLHVRLVRERSAPTARPDNDFPGLADR